MSDLTSQRLQLPIDELIYVPGRGTSLQLFEPPGWLWRKTPRGRIAALALCSDSDELASVENDSRRYFESALDYAIEFNSMPAKAANVIYHDGHMGIDGKWATWGHAGRRMMTAYYLYQRNSLGVMDIDARIGAFVATPGQGRSDRMLPVNPNIDRGLVHTLDARNLLNYYHFATETLASLCLVEEHGLTGDVVILSDTRFWFEFVNSWLAALFPEMSDRLSIRDDREAPATFPESIVSVEFSRLAAQLTEAAMPTPEHHQEFPEFWASRSGQRSDLNLLKHNAFSRDMSLLRARAWRMLDAAPPRETPRDFYVARKKTGFRDRTPGNSEVLVNELQRMGFETVMFEDLSPLEQVRHMRQARCVITPHGAGMTNMMYASPETHVIEISNRTSGGGRWRGFSALAHVAGCAHTTVFCDQLDPQKGGLQPVSMTHAQIERICALAAEVQAGEPRPA